jgi:hypothetical protein
MYFAWLHVDYDRIIKNIERGESRIARKDEIMKAIGKKLDRYKNPWLELKIQYGQNKGKLYNEECDRFMVWILFNFHFLSLFLLKSFIPNSLFCLVVNRKFLILFYGDTKFSDMHDSQTWLWKLG